MEKAEIRAINDLRCAARKLCDMFRSNKMYGASDDLKEAVRMASKWFDYVKELEAEDE